MPGAWWLLSALLLLHSAPWPTVGEDVDADATVCAAVDSLIQLVEFFARNSARFDADSYFGMVVTTMALRGGGRSVLTGRECGESRMIELDRTMEQLDRLLVSFRARVTASSSSSYDRDTYFHICRPLETVLHRLLDPGLFRWRKLYSSASSQSTARAGRVGKEQAVAWLTANSKKLISYDERLGDECLGRILAATPMACIPSQKCRSFFLMAKPDLTGYDLTHSLLFWSVSDEKSCNMRLSNGRPVNGSLLRDTCRKAYTEHNLILKAVDSLNVDWEEIDVAIEYAVLCGLLGYRDFFTDSTVLLLRRLQNQRLGCFGSKTVPAKQQPTGTGAGSGTGTGRKLMHDVEMEGQCSSHTSGLVTAYLAFYLQ